MTCGFEMNPWIRNSSLSNYCFNFSRLILSHCTSLSQVALFWLLASLDLSRCGFQLSSARFDSKQYRFAAKQPVQVCCKASSAVLLQSKQYRFAAKQAVQVCCNASRTGLLQSKQYRLAAKQAVQVCCKARFAAKQEAQVCCKARSTGLPQSKKHRFAAKQAVQEEAPWQYLLMITHHTFGSWHGAKHNCVQNVLHCQAVNKLLMIYITSGRVDSRTGSQEMSAAICLLHSLDVACLSHDICVTPWN